MFDLKNAEICVETRLSLDSGEHGNWFSLSDYSNLSELFVDCASWFDCETNPEYVYVAWHGIPDNLIREEWISPAIFEILDALGSFDDEMLVPFLAWCKTYGWDIAIDEPYKLVEDFKNSSEYSRPCEDESYTQSDYDPPDDEPEHYIHIDTSPGTEIFGECYN